MNQREKILASVVALLVISLAGYYVLTSFQEAMKTRSNELRTLRKKIKDEEFKQHLADEAMARLEIYRAHSLPEESRASQAFYQKRLRAELDKIGFESPLVKPGTTKQRGNHDQHSFTVTAEGTLSQLTELCYNFYSLKLMHKINQITIRPLPKDDQLELKLTFEVLGIEGVEQAPDPESIRTDQLANGNLQAYQEKIVHRNFFGPANQPPVFASLTKHKAELNESFRYSVKAKDPDKDDRLRYYLTDDAPEGLSLSELSGSLSWRPQKLGDYKFTIMVKDNNNPPKSDTKQFEIEVVEPKPKEPMVVVKKPGFDHADQAFLTAITLSNNIPQASLSLRTKGTVMKLGLGDQFTVGSIEGKIAAIRPRQIEIEIDGNLVAVSLGENLSEAKSIVEGEL